MSEEKALEIVMENEKSGINRIALVTSGKGLKGHEFEEVLQIYRNIKEKTGIGLCASLGILSYEQMICLKEVGLPHIIII